MKDKEILINELNDELTKLIKLRIEMYHRNHINEVDLINELIVCPIRGEWENNDIRIPANAISHFIENISIDVIEIDYLSISISPAFKTQYHMAFFPTFTVDDYDEAPIYLTYSDGIFEFEDLNYFFDSLSKLSEQELGAHIKNIQSEITFGTLKKSK